MIAGSEWAMSVKVRASWLSKAQRLFLHKNSLWSQDDWQQHVGTTYGDQVMVLNLRFTGF